MDALTVLREDHRQLERLLERLERPEGLTEREYRALVDQVQTALRQHVDDEEILYAAFRERAAVRGIDLDLLERGEQEHQLIQTLAGELAGMAPEAQGFNAKVRVLVEQVRQHMDVEDTELLTAAGDVLPDDELLDLGRRILDRRRVRTAQQQLKAVVAPVTGSRIARLAGILAGGALATLIVLAVLGQRRSARRRRNRSTVVR